MKKRIALAAAIALAISVGSALPAIAVKPSTPDVASEVCEKVGGTIVASSNSSDMKVWVNSNDKLAIQGGGCLDSPNSTEFSFTGVTAVALEVEGYDVTLVIEKNINGTDVAGNYRNLAFTVQTDGLLFVDGGSMGSARSIAGTVTEEAFSFGTLTGRYFAGDLQFDGGAGADTFDASTVTTTVVTADGGNGNDVIKGGALGDTLDGGAGDDKLYGQAGDDILDGEGGDDQTWGGVGNDDLTGGGDDDIAAPGDGSDTIESAETLLYVDSSAAISVNLTTAGGIVKSTAGDDYYSGATAFVGSALADTLVGSNGKDVLDGGEGADVITGGGDSDVLYGGGGADSIKGGGIVGQADDADTIYGDSGADLINAGAGNDTVYGGGGDDVIYGSSGNDSLFGAKGSDQTWGGRGRLDVCAAEVTDSCEFTK